MTPTALLAHHLCVCVVIDKKHTAQTFSIKDGHTQRERERERDTHTQKQVCSWITLGCKCWLGLLNYCKFFYSITVLVHVCISNGFIQKFT